MHAHTRVIFFAELISFSLSQCKCSFDPLMSLNYKLLPGGLEVSYSSARKMLEFTRMSLPESLHQTLGPAGSWEWNLKHVTLERHDVVVRPI